MVDIYDPPTYPPIIYAAESVEAVAYPKILNILKINQKFKNKLTKNKKDNLVPIPIRHFQDALFQFWHDSGQSLPL